MVTASPVAAQTEPSFKGAGFGRRAAARLIDLLFHYVIWISASLFGGIVIGLAVALGSLDQGVQQRLESQGAGDFILALCGSILYHTISEGLHGATLGKRLLGLHVLRPDGTPASLGSTLGRSFAFLIDELFVGLVGYSSMRSSPLNQRYGDKWANTVVVPRKEHPDFQWPSEGRFALALLLAASCDALLVMLVLATKVF